MTTQRNPWAVYLNDDMHGLFMRQALLNLAQVPTDAMEQAIDDIYRAVTVGPLVDPTAYQDGTKFDNARQFTEVLRAALVLRKLLPEVEA